MTTALEHERSGRTLMEDIILGVAHELNNPNTFVRMNAMTIKKMIGMLQPCLDEYMENHPDATFGPYQLDELRAKLHRQVDGILEASVRIISIADKLKQCTSFAMSELVDVPLRELLKGVIDMHGFLLNKWAVATIEPVDGQEITLRGHRLQLEQAFSILVTNACDAIAERWQDPESRPGRLNLKVSSENGKALIHFTDNGCGMDQATLDKIFTPYFTTKPQGVGDGLGMPLCRAILERHGGSISVTSEKGIGTEMVITLPLS